MRISASRCAPLEKASDILLCLAAIYNVAEQARNAATRTRAEETLAAAVHSAAAAVHSAAAGCITHPSPRTPHAWHQFSNVPG